MPDEWEVNISAMWGASLPSLVAIALSYHCAFKHVGMCLSAYLEAWQGLYVWRALQGQID